MKALNLIFLAVLIGNFPMLRLRADSGTASGEGPAPASQDKAEKGGKDGGSVKDEFRNLGHAFKDGAKATGHIFKKGAKATGKAFKTFGKSLKEGDSESSKAKTTTKKETGAESKESSD